MSIIPPIIPPPIPGICASLAPARPKKSATAVRKEIIVESLVYASSNAIHLLRSRVSEREASTEIGLMQTSGGRTLKP